MTELKELVSRLQTAFTDRLVSVVLYGSAAGGEHDQRFSDLNVLCVLKQITPRELSQAEPVLRWWRQKGNPSPLLLAEAEVFDSADSFPIEFRDMKERRRLLFGVDVIADLHVDTRHHRAQVEHELRSKLLRLRQQGAQVLSNPEALLSLCLSSVSTFLVLGRHALMAAGATPKTERRAVVRQLGHVLDADFTPLETLLDLRAGKSGVDPGDPGELFAQYLTCVERLIRFVDRLDAVSKGGHG
jgi:predicted nucleotidyltransferase